MRDLPRPLRVLHVVKSLGLGGTEKAMQLYVEHLSPDLFAPAVYCPMDGVRGAMLRDAGVPTFIGGDLLACLARFSPHIVHVHRAGWPEPDILRPIKLFRAPVVVETNVFGRHDPSPLSGVVHTHLFISRFCLERYAALHPEAVSGTDCRFLYYPVDTDFFDARPASRDVSRPAVGRISRADPGKWSRLAFDILPLLARRVPGFRYRVVGATDEFRAFVAAQGLDAHVDLLDPVTDEAGLADFYGSVRLLAHANDTGESFGLVIAEAMASGLPVVTHPAAGLRDNAQLELVEHGKTGLVASTAEEYAGAVAWLLDNPDKASAMGRAGRDKARRLYRAQVVTRQLEAVYLEKCREAMARGRLA